MPAGRETPVPLPGVFVFPAAGGKLIDIDCNLQATLWTTTQAAEAAGVSPGVIRIWAHRGHLQRANSPLCRTPRYLAIDVVRAERATRERARRRYAA